MRVLLADKLDPITAMSLEQAGHTVWSEPTLKGGALTEALQRHRPDVLVVRSTKVTAADFEATRELSLVVRAGAGVNTIDLAAAGEHGVFVCNCPGKNADAVAELAMGLLIAVDRRIADNVEAARAGRWDKAAFSKAGGLAGRTLGLLGFGSIGRGVAARAKAFGMQVVAWSRSLTPEKAAAHGVVALPSPLAVAQASQVLSVHLALTDATRGLVNAEILGALPHGAVVLNTARAEVVDQSALLEALERRDLRCGLDVFEGEPSSKQGALDSPLASHPRVVLTHHIGASTTQAQVAVASEVVRIIQAYDDCGTPPSCVNLTTSSATHVLVVRHLDRVGVLAGVLDCLRRAGINVGEMQNSIFRGERAAVARILVRGDPAAVVVDLQEVEHVLHTSIVPVRKEG